MADKIAAQTAALSQALEARQTAKAELKKLKAARRLAKAQGRKLTEAQRDGLFEARNAVEKATLTFNNCERVILVLTRRTAVIEAQGSLLA